MTINAKAHRVVDHPLRHRHLLDISMTRRAGDLRTDVRRMIESNVRLFEKSIHTLPRHVFAAFGVISKRLDSGIRLVTDVLVTAHAYVDARNARNRTSPNPGVTVVTADTNIQCMNIMRKFDRLPGLRPEVDEMSGGLSDRLVSGAESRRTPSANLVRV
jgi:hypothetical protein